jgi:rRNA maturation endonuclease Nob1
MIRACAWCRQFLGFKCAVCASENLAVVTVGDLSLRCNDCGKTFAIASAELTSGACEPCGNNLLEQSRRDRVRGAA